MGGKPFESGQSGNPKGRPKGSRNRLGEAFLDDMMADWAEHGKEAIVKVRSEKPADYVKIVAGILPAEVKVSAPPLDDWTDDELDSAIATLRAGIRHEKSGQPAESSGDETTH